MIIRKLQISNLRNLAQVELAPHPSLNILYGENGAGKTSVLESLAVLSRGRSFRSNKIAQLIGPEKDRISVFAELEETHDADQAAASVRLGLERSASEWQARRSGQDLQQLSELADSLAVVVMEPNSHALISGAPDGRRRYLDWGVFHVEPEYLSAWRRYSRALKQRNAALRQGARTLLESLDPVLAEAGEAMTSLRTAYTAELSTHLEQLMPELSPRLDSVAVEYRRGWANGSLRESLKEHRERDLERGSTHPGPHRADLAISLHGHAVRDSVSRGEQKILATALVLAQARRQCETGRMPLLLLDDLASEFDRSHFNAALEVGRQLGVQVWITGVEAASLDSDHGLFHVEHGQVRKMV